MPFFPRLRKSDRSRRREDDGLHAITFELDSLEFVQASDELGLLRVGGHWIAPAARVLGDIVLLVNRGSERLEIFPLPDLNGVAPIASPTGEGWRGAFTMDVEAAEDPRAQLMLVAGDDARVALPRPGEWEAAQREEEAAQLQRELEGDLEPEPEPEPEYEPEYAEEPEALEPEAPAPAHEEEPEALEPEAIDPAPVPELVEPPAPEVEEGELLPDLELTGLRAEVEVLRVNLDETRTELQEARIELELERRRRDTLDREIRSRRSVEDDLRNAIAMQEAELASAMEQASQDVRRAERRRDLVPAPTGRDHPESPRSKPADEEFLTRLQRANRAGETAV